uniref:Proline-rich protein PRCC n=1 Tax=Hydra vulgaris TaxID=6087 RepID=T2M888_HYDVU
MSLVAAYSESSEDEKEEEENHSDKKTNELSVEDLKAKQFRTQDSFQIDILDDEDWSYTPQNDAVSSNSVSIFSSLPSSNKEKTLYEEEKDDEFLKIKAFSDEIKPGLIINNKEEEAKKFMNLPQPVKGGKKGKVKISLPTYTSGNDSEDEIGSNQICGEEKGILSKNKSSLVAILPKPKNSVCVGENKNKVFQKQVNRQLVPHTLKKTLVSNKGQLQQLNNEKINKSQDELSEDEDVINGCNFFSLGDNTSSIEDKDQSNLNDFNVSRDSLQPASTVQQLCHSPSLKDKESSALFSEPIDSQIPKKENSYFSNLFSKKITNDSTLTGVNDSTNLIKSGNSNVSENLNKISSNGSPHLKQSYSDVTAPYGSAEFNSITSSTLQNSNTKYVENQHFESKTEPFFAYGYQKTYNEPESILTVDPVDVYHQSNVDTLLDNDAIKALVGGKRKFRKEDINIIDVKGEDLQLSKGEYLKNLTQDSGYRPKVSKKDEPRKLEKRKHQITYLAYQAKEREHELRQAWSISKATRRDTQSKYGF